MFLTNNTMLNENELTLRVDLISVRTAVSIRRFKRNFLFELLDFKKNLGDQLKKIIGRTVLGMFCGLHGLL